MSNEVVLGPSQPINQRPSRLAEALWCTGLVIAVLGLLAATVGGNGGLARIVGGLGVALGLAAGALALKSSRQALVGPLSTILTAAFLAIVGGHPDQPRTLTLADGAPRFVALNATPDGVDVDNVGAAPRALAAVPEVMFHPGPFALSAIGLAALSGSQLAARALCAAEWQGGLYAARILALSGSSAKVHFVGWESEWDETLPQALLHHLEDSQLPSASGPVSRAHGSSTPLTSALLVSLYQPAAGLDDGSELGTLTPTGTLYAERLDVSDVPVELALPSMQAGKPFALRSTAAVRFDESGKYFFEASSDGATKMWVDDSAIEPGSAVDLGAGVHQVRLDYRHAAGPKMKLGLRMGKDAKALRPLDMKLQGVSQSVRDANGDLRLVLSEGVLFDVDRDELNASAERALAALFSLNLAPAPTAHVLVEGHTDNTGSNEHNRELSQRRSERVRGWLIAHGRPEATLTSRGFGESRPRVPNDSDAHRKVNRRVELVLSSSGPGSSADVPSAAAPSAVAPKATGPNQAVVDLLQSYYRDLNAASFDADRYFEPNVERYITMTNTTTAAMNHYIRDIFPKQFPEPHFGLEDGSLVQESPGQYVFVEQSSYIMAGKTKSVAKRVRARIRVSARGRLVFLQQFEVLH